MSKVNVLLFNRVVIGGGESAISHNAGETVSVSEDIANSIVEQNAGQVVEAEKPAKPKKPTAAELAAAEAEAAAAAVAQAEADAAAAAALAATQSPAA